VVPGTGIDHPGEAGYNPFQVTVFTTRPDTLFGATYMVLAPEHPLVAEITSPEQKQAVAAYVSACAAKSDMERGLDKEKTGVATGAFAINPVNGEKIPVWIADYVMMGYGSGAIMAVPAHDERDLAFAEKFSLPIVQVVQPTGDADWRGYTDHGTAVNSGFLDGLKTSEAKKKIITWLEEKGRGTRKIQYKLRDWLFSRQRYWGEPFPLLWDKETGRHCALPESELPLLQPEMEEFKPTGDPRGPLLNATEWIDYSEQFTRETNTMPQWAGSCWYYLRYCDPDNAARFLSEEAEDYWGGDDAFVDLYVGGTEHAVLHLLYARFWHKVLHDLGYLKSKEPFKKLVNQGLILGEDGQKMSKSLGNVVNPDDVVSNYGADSLRLYEMFMGPLEQVKPWSMSGVEGVHRFLAKVWRLAFTEDSDGEWHDSGKITSGQDDELAKVTHQTIRKVEEAIESLRFNTGISSMMECTNAYTSAGQIPRDLFLTFLKVLNPFAPHLTEEINAALGESELLSEQAWPEVDESLLVESEIQLIVQVNGKLRSRLMVPVDLSREEAEARALAEENVQSHLAGKTVRKVIVVPGKLVNIVAN
jgi:leucyl-tRNA synthetase